ncbi:threonine dehydratase [Wenzhouxiangella sp. AB-CW3]|uniref:threonine dehydratase n=1 Tax=Wenzhouxiangella sp. AB-CW3 TaxID=2771012 RepID=UPI00168A636B|nr:threonine dehydratase [Wenzhouxiangella sp. AB-CW3]QOC24057.1 threonine dehydratase [Wenzhouxiangella sp. AB-CW3]
MNPGIEEIQAATEIVYSHMPPTPQYCWPLLCERLGTEVWVKHENHTPVGAFKIRGGLVYFAHFAKTDELRHGVVSATRGNHGQSLGFAARHYGVPATVLAPHGNSVEKNAAMRALGVELIEHGEDFQSAREQAAKIARDRGLHMMGSFHPLLVAGVATYAYELMQTVRDIDVIYVPIGLGSGICAMVAARDALGLRTEIVGVVSAHARAYAESFASGTAIESDAETRLADGMACRVPDPDALEVIWRGVHRVVTVTDDEVAAAMRLLFECTHNVSEGAGAAATAAAMQECERNAGRKVALVLSGGNVDREVFAGVLARSSSTPID